MAYEQIYYNGTVITIDKEEQIGNWVAIGDGKIVAVGSGEGIPKEGMDALEKIDLHGATVLPGLYDAHCHVMPTGFFLNSANLLETKCIDDVLDLLRIQAKDKMPGEWIFGAGFMSQNMKENRYPNKDELDLVTKDHPIMITAQTLHGGSLNSKALSLIEIPDVDGVGRDEYGELDGVLLSDDAFFPTMSKVMGLLPKERLKDFIDECAQYGASKGVTSIIGLIGQFVEGDTDVEIIESGKGSFPVNFTTFYQTWNLENIKRYDLPRIGGCLTLDGAGFEYTMALNEPYPERPERRGFLIHTDEEVYQLISEAHAQGIQTAFHALGDRAIDQLLYVYNQVIGEQGAKDLRHRVEHFSLPTDAHMDLAAKLGLVCSMQPAFTGLWGEPVNGYYDLLLGRERASRMEVFPEIIKRGGIICGGSDSPVTLVDPVFGIACLINNPDPRRNVSVTDAIKIFTINAAYSVHQDTQKGSIEPGKDADLTIIDKNPYEYADSKEIYNTKVLKTIKNGVCTFAK
ncbi:MAG: amidohydrolase [Clostridiales Family XIII bacterium]|jgi:predicted amidohydrolase YtcJ|nr:amidohydrolase [Clostridiales Family XIII bacterium]